MLTTVQDARSRTHQRVLLLVRGVHLHRGHHGGQSRELLLGRVALRDLQERLVLLGLLVMRLSPTAG